jgi:DNA replication protein DnaC
MINVDQPQEITCHLNAFLASPLGFMLFSGNPGSGKTFAALELYNEFSPHKLPAYDRDIAWFITQAELNMMWKKWSKDGDETMFLNAMSRTKLLIIDDLGTRTPTESFMDFLYALADNRYTLRSRRGTIITTNLSATPFRLKFGEPFFSRVASGVCLKFEAKDRRFKQEDNYAN